MFKYQSFHELSMKKLWLLALAPTAFFLNGLSTASSAGPYPSKTYCEAGPKPCCSSSRSTPCENGAQKCRPAPSIEAFKDMSRENQQKQCKMCGPYELVKGRVNNRCVKQ